MTAIKLETKWADDWVEKQQWPSTQQVVMQAAQQLWQRTGTGQDWLGWLDLPDKVADLTVLRQLSDKIVAESQVLVVIGIGGSYLGGQAGIDFVYSPLYNQLSGKQPEIYFVGNNLSGQTWQQVWEIIGERDFSVNIISKSGTTLEPALAFGWWQDKLKHKYGDKARERIYATTDAKSGLLHEQAVSEGYSQLIVPDDVGGRYSALTPVALLPWLVAGIDGEQVLAGARQARADLQKVDENNPALQYAAYRYYFHQAGKVVETLATYEPCLAQLGRWWQQLFGESEGKEGKGLLPMTLQLTADLHSLGQYLQEGQRTMMTTTLWLDQAPADAKIILDERSEKMWPELMGKDVGWVNQCAWQATVEAHSRGGVPNLSLRLARADAWHLGYILFFFEVACAISAYALTVNPFDQPGVAAYKQRLGELLQTDT